MWTLIPLRSFIHKKEKHKHVTEEELAISWFCMIGWENETTATQILQQQWRYICQLLHCHSNILKVASFYFILHTATFYVLPRESVKFKLYPTGKSIHVLFTLIWIITCREESLFSSPPVYYRIKDCTAWYGDRPQSHFSYLMVW